MQREEIERLLKEKEKRNALTRYGNDFSLFASEQIKIITKDANQGFVPFNFNRCQEIITEKLSEQLKETGKVRAIILKARQQGISTYCAGRVFWKSYNTPYARSVVTAIFWRDIPREEYREVLVIPCNCSLPQTAQTPVSYTHLTLPTNREV